MKRLIKVLSMTLAVSMIVSLFPIIGFAADEEQTVTAEIGTGEIITPEDNILPQQEDVTAEKNEMVEPVEEPKGESVDSDQGIDNTEYNRVGLASGVQETTLLSSDNQSEDNELADYTAVDAAIAKIPADLSIYTDESVATLKEAQAAVVRDKVASEQTAVDAMAKAIEDAIAALVEKPVEDGKIQLSITNNTGMFKAESAYLETVDKQTTLVVALSGSGYHELFKGTYEQAAANGANEGNWIHGAVNTEVKWEFSIPVSSGESYIPIVAISNSYVEKYRKGENVVERAFYPRQFVLDIDAQTLVTDDYNSNQLLSITNNVDMFKPETAVLETVGGPNSNNYKSNLLLTMGSDSFDKVCYGTKEEAPTSEAVYDINGRTFTIPVRWVEIFGQPETMQTIIGSTVTFSFHSVRKNEWYERKLTINEENGTLVIDEVKEDDSSDDGTKPSTPTPTPGGNSGDKKDYEDTTGGSTGAVDNSTSLADGVYTPDKFSFSGGTGKIAITCTKVEVKGGKAYATIVFRNTKSGSTEMGYVKASGGKYYCTQSGGTSIVTIPVELNKNNTILAMTTKMNAAHEIAYTIFVYIAGADAQKGSALTSNTELDKEAPVIAGLEFQDEEEIEYAEYFKVFNYSDGIRLLEVDMRLRKEDQKDDDNDEQTSTDTEDIIEEEAQEEPEEDTVKTVIDEETGMEITLVASKAEAQAELYKGNVIKYLLVPEDVEIPAGLDKETIVITLPVENVYSGDKEITDTMKDLKVDNLIKSQPEEDKDNTEIQAAGDYKDLDFKALVKSKCDVVLLPEDSVQDKKERENFNSVAEDLANLDIAVIVDRAAYEKTDNAKAEWLKVYGILFGCEQEAKDAFNMIKK